jgi:hypothetical protein
MSQATCHFHAELNDFLPPQRRHTPFAHSFAGRVSVKDMIESTRSTGRARTTSGFSSLSTM